MFNANQLLESLLSAGKELTEQGKELVEDKLNMPKDEGEHSAMLNGMGKGALTASALALLLGTKTGRSLGGGALKIGSLTALGGLAYKAYQNWQSDNQGQQTQTQAPVSHLEQLPESQNNQRSQKILQAIIAAAKADGHIDDNERQMINQFIEQLGESSELSQFIQSELNKPLDPSEIAQDTDIPGLAAEVYLMSRIIIDETNFMEKTYLSELAKALNLEDDLVAQLDQQAQQTE